MKQQYTDWKDYANSQFGKALALSLTVLLFAMMVTPKIGPESRYLNHSG